MPLGCPASRAASLTTPLNESAVPPGVRDMPALRRLQSLQSNFERGGLEHIPPSVTCLNLTLDREQKAFLISHLRSSHLCSLWTSLEALQFWGG